MTVAFSMYPTTLDDLMDIADANKIDIVDTNNELPINLQAKYTQNMPNYFADYDTTVHFISEETMKKEHAGMAHGGFVISRTKCGSQKEHFLFRLFQRFHSVNVLRKVRL